MQRNITIKYAGFKKNANLMLCLTPPDAGKLGKDQNLVAWKVINVAAKQTKSADVTYISRYAFGENEPDVGNVIKGSTIVEVKEGQSVDLTESDEYGPTWGDPYSNGTELMKAWNKTDYMKTMSVGTVKGDGALIKYSPSFVWTGVGKTLSVEAQLTPRILCYVNLDYQENEVIRGDITSDNFYTIELDAIPANSVYVFAEGPQGDYTLTRVTEPAKFSISRPSTPSVQLHGVDLPPVKITYSLKLGWARGVDDHDAQEILDAIVTVCNTKGLVCDVAHGGNENYRVVKVSRKGLSGALLYEKFKLVLADTIDHNWTVDEEKFTNVSYKDGGKDVVEFVAPKSLAWYYAK